MREAPASLFHQSDPSHLGAVAKRLCTGLQIRVGRFDSGPRLQTNAGVAQLVERDLAKVEVTSSSLVTRSSWIPVRAGEFESPACAGLGFTKTQEKCGCSSVGRARPCQGRGHEFEPRYPLQIMQKGSPGGFPFCFLAPLVSSGCAADSVAQLPDAEMADGLHRPGRAEAEIAG
jgi:hypothetical protein